MTVIVVENRPRWVPELQRRFLGTSVHVRACRSVGDGGRAAAGEAAGGVLVFDLAVSPGELLHWLGGRNRKLQSIPVLAYAPGATAELEWVLRDLGAAAVLPETTTSEELAAVCRKHLPDARRHPIRVEDSF